MTTKRTPIASILASLLLASPLTTHAAVLGEVTTLSAIGAPLRVEIGMLGGNAAEIGSCLRIVPATANDAGLPVISRARISAASSGRTSAIVISSPESMQHPAAQLTLENVCDSRLRRSYTLLFPFAPTPAQAAPAPASTSGRRAPAGSQIWTTAPGESLNGIARALYPDDSATQRAFVRAATRANPSLFPDRASRQRALPPGTTLIAPNLAKISRESAPAATSPRSAPRPSPAPLSPATRSESLAPVTGDRLVVETDDSKQKSSPLQGSNQAVSSLEQREREISGAIDRSIVAQMELLARIKQLEQIQARLLEDASRIGIVAAPPAPVAEPDAGKAVTPEQVKPAEDGGFDWSLLGALGIAALAIAAMLHTRAKRREVPATDWNTARTTAKSAPASVSILSETAPATEMPPLTNAATTVAALPLEWDHTPSGFGSVDLAPLVEEEEVEEHDSAIELAEIMMSFGRVHGAAETLADFIRSNPKQAVTPWLKLLEVYRAANLRNEFDALARQLNKTFNVKTVTWDNFDESLNAPDTLEKMPHLIALLQKEWGTRECQATLQKLLRDNRDGTRQGFPLKVVDEILCLAGILEQELGPYRAPLNVEADLGPQTEPPPA